jgi:phage regulator Rha-like protein
MSKNEIEKFDESLKDKIYSIRGFQVMLDRDLAELYGVETKRLNEAVKRNKERFPEEFCFQLNITEYTKWKSQIATSIGDKMGLRKIPYAFTEHGVVMLSSVLKSKKAIEINIQVVNAFISMRKFLQTNRQLFQRVDNLEIKLLETDKKVEKIIDVMSSGDSKPTQGIFYENQIFDAYKFVSDLFRSAMKSILIIDNYIDDSVLVHLTKVAKNVKVKILTKSISDQLALDVKKFNSQYFPIEVIAFTHAHDRFIIIDNKDVYHVVASLKDLGKKWFAFSKIEKSDMELLGRLEKY